MSTIIERRYENLFRALDEQQAYKQRVESYPVCLTLDAASVCQLKCPFCIHGMTSPLRPYTSLDWDLFKSLIDELGPYLFHADLDNWGEPFLNKKLLEMITYLKNQAIRVRLSTNISLPLTEEFLEQFIRCQPDYVIISIDGFSQETYEIYRVQGDFHLAMSNLETLARLRHKLKLEKPRLVWQFLVFSFNEHELPKAAQHAQKIGVDFRPSAPYIDLNRHPDWLPSQERYIREPYQSEKLVQKGLPPNDSGLTQLSGERNNLARAIDEDSLHGTAVLGDISQDKVASSGSSTPSSERYPCDWLYLKACINADGSLSSCCGRYPGDPNWGELGQGAFHRLWNNSCLQEARRCLTEVEKEYPAEIICARCPLPEIQQVSNSVILDAILDAPQHYRKQAKAKLDRFSRSCRLERQSLRLAGKVLQAVPYRYRNPLKQRLRYGMEQGALRGAMGAIFKFISG
jgi:MoaA/NifB/PqqE/SkfB family radical SAM enzyme